jgi:hypothetical protein
MTVNSTPIDISNMPDLARLAEEVAATQKPRILKRHKKTVAILMPVEPVPTAKKQQAIKETLALAGSWGDRDWNEVEAELDRIRHSSKPTPPLEL